MLTDKYFPDGFTIFQVIEIDPDMLHKNEEYSFSVQKFGEVYINMSFNEHSCLILNLVEVCDMTNAEKIFHSCPLNIISGTIVPIIIAGLSKSTTVSISSIGDIPSISDSSEIMTIALLERRLLPEPWEDSTQASNKDNICADWMKWRSDNLSVVPIFPDRRYFSENELVKALFDSGIRLRKMIFELDNGDLTSLPTLAAELRSLIFWKDRDFPLKSPGKHIPLLFRVAQFKNLPLPIYANGRGSAIDFIPSLSKNLLMSLNNISGSIFKKQKNDELIDIQDWLTSKIVIFPNTDVNSKNSYEGELRDLIAGYAQTYGGAHHDPGPDNYMDNLKNTTLYDIDILARILVNVAETVHDLIEYVKIV